MSRHCIITFIFGLWHYATSCSCVINSSINNEDMVRTRLLITYHNTVYFYRPSNISSSSLSWPVTSNSNASSRVTSSPYTQRHELEAYIPRASHANAHNNNPHNGNDDADDTEGDGTDYDNDYFTDNESLISSSVAAPTSSIVSSSWSPQLTQSSRHYSESKIPAVVPTAIRLSSDSDKQSMLHYIMTKTACKC
jgi:hypothetical protein